jgi:hypothetical protein
MFSSGGKHDGSERNRRFGRRSLITLRAGRELRSDHPLLARGLKVTYDLRNDADQLAGDVGHILLRQLSLLAKGHGTAERRLELRCAELSARGLRWMAETKLAEASELLAEASELTLTALTLTAALHGRIVRLLLALQHSNDLRNDGQDLPHDFIYVLRAQLPRRLAVGCVADSAERILCLREDLRQRRYQLTHDLVHVLLRKLALLAAPLLAPSHRLPAPAGLLTAVLPILLAVGRLSESNTALSNTALSKTALSKTALRT